MNWINDMYSDIDKWFNGPPDFSSQMLTVILYLILCLIVFKMPSVTGPITKGKKK